MTLSNSYSYSLFGLRLNSDMPLPGLVPDMGEREADVEIRHGPVDAGDDEERHGYVLQPGGTLLNVPRVGRFWIQGGREIIVDPAEKASERNVLLFLLGSAFGALLHQRGMMPLHANAIEVDGQAVAFSGHSGAGKSTIAAWFYDRGHRILADDVFAVGFDADRAIAYPGLPRLRLWREALEASGRSAGEYDRSFDDLDKYEVPALRSHVGSAIPLKSIYILRRAPEDGAEASIRRLSGVDAVDALISNTYRGGYLKMIGGTGQHLMQCLRLVKAVPVYEATRIWGFDSFEEQATRLADHARNGDS